MKLTQEKFKAMEENAKDYLTKNKEHPPIIVTIKKDEVEVFPFSFTNDFEKVLYQKSIRKMIEKIKVDEYFFITEGWCGQNVNVRPMEDKKRREALITLLFQKGKKNKISMQFFHKENDKIIFDEVLHDERLSESYSTWNFFKHVDINDEIKKATEHMEEGVNNEKHK